MVYKIDDKATYVPANTRNITMKKKSPTNVKITKGSGLSETKNDGEQFLKQFSVLFIVCKFVGLYPLEWNAFMQNKKLKKSNIGIICVLTSFVIITILYTLLILILSTDKDESKTNQSTLTQIISMFLTYAVLFMMFTDQMNAIYNQGRINSLYERLNNVDATLYLENIHIKNGFIKKRIIGLLIIAVSFEVLIFITSITWLFDQWKWTNLFWLFCSLPTFINTLDKIWFVVTLWALKYRFTIINTAIDNLTLTHINTKIGLNDNNNIMTKNMEWDFLRREFQTQGAINKRNRISPKWADPNMEKPFNFQLVDPIKSTNLLNIDTENIDFVDIENKLNILCRQHDELCEVGKYLNELWGYPIIILMAYGFLMFTSQLYFYYCASQNQPIPDIYVTANSTIITIILLSYTGGKCIYLVYLSWITALECKRTGLSLHQCSVAMDNNYFYNIVNHLSLKLLNHSVDFSACGFFELNMETIVGVVSGITSYLIILIQFNLAAQQAKNYYGDGLPAPAADLADSSNSSLLSSYLEYENTTFMPSTSYDMDYN